MKGQSDKGIRVMFYNTENLYDTEDDPATNDDDFTPTGKMHWTKLRYDKKLINIYKVITAVGGWQPPEIIGLSEIENRKVLNDLFLNTPLSAFRYGIVHYESQDPRGIDVGLAFRSDRMRVYKQEKIIIHNREHPHMKTRDILFASFIVDKKDTLNVFVNHWPSRRRGELESEDLRLNVASILRFKIDSLQKHNEHAKILIMGDFNDEPNNESITNLLKSQQITQYTSDSKLFNLSYKLLQTSQIGTHKFRGNWEILDQIIVSGSLLNAAHGLSTKEQNIHIFSANFIFLKNKKNDGIRPYPTYSGPKYLGGYSDHLPIFLDLTTQ